MALFTSYIWMSPWQRGMPSSSTTSDRSARMPPPVSNIICATLPFSVMGTDHRPLSISVISTEVI